MPSVPLVLLLAAPALAADVSLVPDTRAFSEGQTVGLALTVTDTSLRGGVPQLQLPDGLTASFESRQEQQLMQNFNLTSSTLYRYALTALRAGDYVIAPMELATAAGRLRTGSVALHVAPRGASTSGVNELTGELSSSARWVGQTVVYHLRFATDRQLANGNWIPPEGKGFVLQPGVKPESSNYTVGEGDKRVSIQDLYLPLRFTDAGSITLPGGALQAQFAVERNRRRRGQVETLFPDLGMFTDVRSEVFSAPSTRLSIQAPPRAGRPADFGGLVGQFTLSARVNGAEPGSPVRVNVGDTVTIVLELTGNAPVTGVTLPPITGDGFRVYDDQPAVTTTLQGGALSGAATFKRAIVPERPGPLTIPAVQLSAFDPAAGQYVTLSSPALTLEVGGAAATAQVASFAPGAAPAAPAPEPADALLPVRPAPSLQAPWPGAWAWALLLPGALGTALVAMRGLWARRRTTVVRSRLGFADLPDEPHARLSGLEQIFREAVADRLGIGAAAVHGEDLARLGEHAAEAQAVYRLVERARYAGGDAASVQVSALEAALRALVEKLR